MELLNSLQKIYERAPTILAWEESNQPKDTLIYKSGLSHQAKALVALSNVTRTELDLPKVISIHSSKSVGLPVSCFKLEHGFIIIRDNFYDIKVAVVSNYPVEMDYHLVHKEYSQEAYDFEKKRCYDYCSRPPTSHDFNIKDYDSDAWMSKWSHDSFIRENGKIWRASCVSSVYCEGMPGVLTSEVFKSFVSGLNKFTCALGTYAQVGVVIDAVQRSNFNKFHEERAAQERTDK